MANRPKDTFKPTADTIAFLNRGRGPDAPDVQNAIEQVWSEISRKAPTTALYSVIDFGAVGDGVVDDTQAFIDTITAKSGSKVIYIPPGVYNLSTWSPLTYNDDLVIVGAGKHLVHIIGNNKDFLTTGGNVNISGLTLNGFNDVIRTTESQNNLFRLDDVSLKNGRQAITVLCSSVERIEIVNCDITNFTSYAMWFESYCEQALIANNYAENIARYWIRWLEGKPEHVKITGNKVVNLHSQGFSGTEAVARAMQIACVNLTVSDNHFENIVSTDHNSNVLYNASESVLFANNYCRNIYDGGHVGTNYVISDKSQYLKGTRILNNTFIQDVVPDGASPKTIVHINRDGAAISGNIFIGPGINNAIVIGNTNPHNVTITNNVVRDISPDGHFLYIFGNFGRLVITSNIVEGHKIGLIIQTTQSDLPGPYVVFRNNIFKGSGSDEYGVRIRSYEGVPEFVLNRIFFEWNEFINYPTLLSFGGTKAIDELIFRWNILDNVETLYTGSTVPEEFINENNRSY